MLRGPEKELKGLRWKGQNEGVALRMARKGSFPGYVKMNRKVLETGEQQKGRIKANPNFTPRERKCHIQNERSPAKNKLRGRVVTG